ncbi:MAG: histidine kinase [Desulfovibrio sp.]|nr:histidine kinase [Desulfovibrio sp.]|tara:strand:+ start:1490 stop:1885 length:396 start_codon:yes stop_codon:yes gene_type:complete
MTKPITRVRDVMQTEVLCIDGMATSKEAAEMMRTYGVSELLVDKRSEDDAWAIVSIMDLVQGVIVPDKKGEDVCVYEIMTKPIITVPAEMDIRYAIRLIHRIGLHRAPVEHMGEIVGMVTLESLIHEHDLL